MKGVIELPFINNKLRRHYAEKIRLKQATGKSCDCAKLQGLVANGVVQAQKAGNAIGQVQTHSRQVRDSVAEISNSLREQSSASTEIAQNVEQIAQMAEENNAAASGNAVTADRLRQLAETLSVEVARFRI